MKGTKKMVNYEDILAKLNEGTSEEEIAMAFAAALNKAKTAKAEADAAAAKTNDRNMRFIALIESAKDFITDFYPSNTELIEALSELQEDPKQSLDSIFELVDALKEFRSAAEDMTAFLTGFGFNA